MILTDDDDDDDDDDDSSAELKQCLVFLGCVESL